MNLSGAWYDVLIDSCEALRNLDKLIRSDFVKHTESIQDDLMYCISQAYRYNIAKYDGTWNTLTGNRVILPSTGTNSGTNSNTGTIFFFAIDTRSEIDKCEYYISVPDEWIIWNNPEQYHPKRNQIINEHKHKKNQSFIPGGIKKYYLKQYPNPYENNDMDLDLHGKTVYHARKALIYAIKKSKRIHNIKVITGKGLHSIDGPKILPMVKRYLYSWSIPHSVQDGYIDVFARVY